MSDPIEQWRRYDAARDVALALIRGSFRDERLALATEVAMARLAVEQAVIRSHPDVIGLVAAARRSEWVQGFYEESGHRFWSCPDCEAEAYENARGRIVGTHEPGCSLAAALAPFEEKAE